MIIQRKKIMVVFGTRPEAIKMCPLIHKLKSCSSNFETTVCVTAQHREMLDQVLTAFGITPDVDLNIMRGNQDLFDVTSEVLIGMRSVLKKYQPDIVLVHGDTTTAMATAIASFYLKIKVGHVEAGLRTNNIRSPYPEEFNRQIIDKVADLHFCPTDRCRQNLLSEGFGAQSLIVTGNTVIDALHLTLDRLATDKKHTDSILNYLSSLVGFRPELNKYILITGHRRENFGGGLTEICRAVQDLSCRFPDVFFVYPVHLNPNVREIVFAMLGGNKNIKLIDPLDYEPFCLLMKFSYIVLTDSGGIQEEAPSLGKPVLVLRNLTERSEAVDAGTVRLVGTDCDRIVSGVLDLLSNNENYMLMVNSVNPYGDGKACEKISEVLERLDVD